MPAEQASAEPAASITDSSAAPADDAQVEAAWDVEPDTDLPEVTERPARRRRRAASRPAGPPSVTTSADPV